MGLFAGTEVSRVSWSFKGLPVVENRRSLLKLANEFLARGMRPILVRFRDFRLTTFNRADELIEDALAPSAG